MTCVHLVMSVSEKADMALFISLEQATAAMVKDAPSVGFYESPNGKNMRACGCLRSRLSLMARNGPSIRITSRI